MTAQYTVIPTKWWKFKTCICLCQIDVAERTNKLKCLHVLVSVELEDEGRQNVFCV